MKLFLKFMTTIVLSFFSFNLSVLADEIPQNESHIDYLKDIKPIFNGRCVQCHSCYNSPCQLKLSSAPGIDRGLINGFKVYDSKRIRKAPMTRLGVDRKNTKGWRKFSRKYNFKPVIFNYGDEEKNLENSFIYSLVKHKKQNSTLAIDDHANYSSEQAENSRVCPDSSEALKEHLVNRPNAGMPYGLPALEQNQIDQIEAWTRVGSPLQEDKVVLTVEETELKKEVEGFFNNYKTNLDVNESLRRELVSRYIYEHLFLAHIYLKDGSDKTNYFRLVRSKDQCETEFISEIATRRAWNSAGEDFNYCLKPHKATLVHKTHITYKLDRDKITRWNHLFYGNEWGVKDDRNFLAWALGGFSKFKFSRKDIDASNPLKIFKDIPVKSRYQFLLDDARYHAMTFIRGPVCKGNTAVNSIDEQFYVYFIDPNSDLMVRNKEFYSEAIDLQILPARKGSEQILAIRPIMAAKKTMRQRNKYRELRAKIYEEEFPSGYSIEDIWDGGEEKNPTASLTVFRHYDSSSVLQGAVGATPKTIFVLDYSIIERLVYDLVVGFDVYSDMAHQVQTRIYMSYLRMEAEENFLNFLPMDVRIPMRKSWYTEIDGTGIENRILNKIVSRRKSKLATKFPLFNQEHPNQFDYSEFDLESFYEEGDDDIAKSLSQEQILRDYRSEFVQKINEEFQLNTLGYRDELNPMKPLNYQSKDIQIGQINDQNSFSNELSKVTDIRALNAPWVLKMPSLSYILIKDGSDNRIYTFIRNKEHYNVAWISGEDGRRNHTSDSMVAYRGVGGSYPNHFFVIDVNDAQEFLTQMINIESPEDYEKWIVEFGTPRSGPGSEKFWKNSDELHRVFKESQPIEYGALDYNRYGIDYRHNNDSNEKDAFYNGLPEPLKNVFDLIEE